MSTAPTLTAVRHLCRLVAAPELRDAPDRQLLEAFAARREEDAFAALLRRHGPMVLGVCRRILAHAQDAEDAFQATFLTLARKADSIRECGSVGSWLYGVAQRISRKARRQAAARHRREQRAATLPAADPLAEVTARELLGAFDEEVLKLPPRERAALVQCYLEGATRDEAARRLGCSVSTVHRLVERGKHRLRARLDRRGLSLPGALLAAGMATAAVPHGLLAATVRATLSGALPARVAEFAEGATPAIVGAKLKAAAAVLVAGILAVGVGWLSLPAQAQRPAAEEPPRPLAAQPVPEPDPKEMTVAGRVVAADGKPVPGATVVVVGRPRRQHRSGDDAAADRIELLGEGKTDGEGRFRMRAARTSSARFWEVRAVATAKGHAHGWQLLGPDVEEPQARIALAPEQVIRGQLVDLQGQPAPGVRVAVTSMGRMEDGDVKGMLWTTGTKPAGFWPEEVTTDAKGRFEIRGCNRDRGLQIGVVDKRYARSSFEIRPAGEKRPERVVHGLDSGGYLHTSRTGPDDQGQKEVVSFTLTPPQVLEGRVVCGDTGAPAAGAVVSGTKADADGRFRIPLGRTEATTLDVIPREGEPYLPIFHRVVWPKGAVKHEVEVRLPRGVVVRGKVTEAGSGKPVGGACVQFWPRQTDAPGVPRNLLDGWQRRERTKEDGTFQIAIYPGVGHLMVQGPTPDYVHEEIGGEVLSWGRPGGSRYYPDAFVKLDVSAKGEPKEVAVKLRRGVTVRVKLLGPDGKPVSRAVVLHRLYAYVDMSWHFATEARGGAFEVHGLDPKGSVPVYFLDAEHQCGAVVELSGKQAGQEVTVRLAPCGKATARYVDDKGTPLAGFQASPDIIVTPAAGGLTADRGSLTNLDRHNYWDKVKTDGAGRITFPALIPGATYLLERFEKDGWVPHKEFTVESGKTVDLGDVKIGKGP